MCSSASLMIAALPGANNLRGSNPLPSKSLPASIYSRVALRMIIGILYLR